MHLRSLLIECGPWGMAQDPVAMYARVRKHWRGSRVYITQGAARRAWRRGKREPEGASERLAADIEAAVLAEGGTHEQAGRVLLACMSTYVFV